MFRDEHHLLGFANHRVHEDKLPFEPGPSSLSRRKFISIGEFDLAAESGETKEIIDALKSFSFSAAESKEAIKALKDFDGNTSDKIRSALRFLGQKPKLPK